MAAHQEKAGSQDPAKAAKLLSDIAAVGQETDLSGITVVEADEEYLQNASNQAGLLREEYATIGFVLQFQDI